MFYGSHSQNTCMILINKINVEYYSMYIARLEWNKRLEVLSIFTSRYIRRLAIKFTQKAIYYKSTKNILTHN